jgi:DNA-binding response OmpR family regulator
MKVLLVEDSPTQAEFYRLILEDVGLEVIHVTDGPTALDAASIAWPDLVILDVNLPGGMDGMQVCARLHRMEETRNVPVIMLTQRDTSRDAMMGMEAGAVDYIAKDDFVVETLYSTLRQLHLIMEE